MKRLKTLFVVLAICSFGSLAAAADRWETLRAINMVENPTNQTGFGSKGELGPYQFRSSTWRMYTKKPFRMANDRETADQVAVLHYEWLKVRLKSAGIDPNSFNIALAWNCGITAVLNGRVPMQTYHYAERVNNLTDLYRQHQQEALVQTNAARETDFPASLVDFKPAGRAAAPEFKIVSEPFLFRVAGDSPRFVIAPPQSRFVLVVN